MGAEPKSGAARKLIAKVADSPALKDNLEGVGLYDAGGGRGYIVVSSQGNNSYAVFRREGDNAYVGSFAVTANAAKGIDGVSETDGGGHQPIARTSLSALRPDRAGWSQRRSARPTELQDHRLGRRRRRPQARLTRLMSNGGREKRGLFIANQGD